MWRWSMKKFVDVLKNVVVVITKIINIGDTSEEFELKLF